jgi:DNA polymerase-3 subunit epsilon
VRLSHAARELGLPVHRPHHADGDALTTAQLFLALATRLNAREAQTVGSLARSRVD